ncbi:hypothetical protein G7Y89_g10097 [Cudoniella acicularis]|uniref:Uncharacterized protein n=1 Tax=Cudoniella acicularis TaxID=354080 RepID=A0A8H4VZ27_9HELO|nr:hypothetical protein G7Y89_g10097 [Cudoniella acicularis]
MIVKERVHKVIVQVYFFLLKMLKRYPSPQELASQANQKASEAMEQGEKMVREGYDGVSGRVESVVESGKVMVENTAEEAGVVGNNIMEAGKDITERAGIVGNNAKEAAKSADNLASQEAGHLLGNAQEQLGDNIEEVGKGLKDNPKKDGNY